MFAGSAGCQPAGVERGTGKFLLSTHSACSDCGQAGRAPGGSRRYPSHFRALLHCQSSARSTKRAFTGLPWM